MISDRYNRFVTCKWLPHSTMLSDRRPTHIEIIVGAEILYMLLDSVGKEICNKCLDK